MNSEVQHPLKDTPLYVGPGVVLEGHVTHKGANTDRAIISGVFSGDIEWNGLVEVPEGGEIKAGSKVVCRELSVAGMVSGESVTLQAGLLRLSSTARIRVGEINLPPGGLEQARGATINGTIQMTEQNQFFQKDDLVVATPKVTVPSAQLGTRIKGTMERPSAEDLARPLGQAHFLSALSPASDAGADTVDVELDAAPVAVG
jgi:cytoskeletal protein CcmA (bactofilin family)